MANDTEQKLDHLESKYLRKDENGKIINKLFIPRNTYLILGRQNGRTEANALFNKLMEVQKNVK